MEHSVMHNKLTSNLWEWAMVVGAKTLTLDPLRQLAGLIPAAHFGRASAVYTVNINLAKKWILTPGSHGAGTSRV